jgi:peroxiredoxin Q/BCP
MEALSFREKLEEFEKLDTVVVGVSTDTLPEQKKFAEEQGLPFPLVCDPKKLLVDRVGCGQGNFAARITLVIDKEGKIRKIYEKVSPRDHAEEVLEFVKQHLAPKPKKG